MDPILTPVLLGGAAIFAVRCYNDHKGKAKAQREIAMAESVNPTPAQLYALREAIRMNDIVLLGDCDHSRLAIKAFAFHPDVQKVMAEEGVGLFGTETGVASNTMFEMAEMGLEDPDDIKRQMRYVASSDHITAKKSHRKLVQLMANFVINGQSLGRPYMRGLDNRNVSGHMNDFTGKLTIGGGVVLGAAYKTLIDPHASVSLLAIVAAAMLKPKKAYQAAMHALDDAPLAETVLAQHRGGGLSSIQQMVLEMFTKAKSRLAGNLQPETPPVTGQAMRAQKSVIFYGVGHFDGTAREAGLMGLNDHLKKAGLKIATIPVFVDEQHARERISVTANEPDMPFAFYARPSPDTTGVVLLGDLPKIEKPTRTSFLRDMRKRAGIMPMMQPGNTSENL